MLELLLNVIARKLSPFVPHVSSCFDNIFIVASS